jgi:uncharacterized protein YigE (DUF2233 family)
MQLTTRHTFLAIGLLGTAWLGHGTFATAADNSSTALQTIAFRGQAFTIRTVDPKTEDIRLFIRNDDKVNGFLDFPDVDAKAESEGTKENEHLVFAANAGMFEADGKPVGLLVQDGKETAPLNLSDAPGNFYMKPNGVFLINEKHEAMVIESSNYAVLLTPAVWATQSGPLLVHGGNIHPDFIEDSKNLNIRSGVGVRKDGIIVFAISRSPVNFYNFALLFNERLKCPNALYLDGTISAFYTPDHSKVDDAKTRTFHQFGPVFGVMDKAK